MENLPQHVAIILDGNGRWAKKRGLPRTAGHAAGAKNVETITTAASHMGIRYLTLYAFSTENWKRSMDEVSTLMKLLAQYLIRCRNLAMKENVRVRFIGNLTALSDELQETCRSVTADTAGNTGMTLTIALNYGGRDEIVRAVGRLLKDRGELQVLEKRLSGEDQTHFFNPCEGSEGNRETPGPETDTDRADARPFPAETDSGTALKNAGEVDSILTEEEFAAYLDTAGMPDPDLMIRTSGEERISNFLPWQLCYSEFYFTDVAWPDFSEVELKAACEAYASRDRRFGGVK